MVEESHLEPGLSRVLRFRSRGRNQLGVALRSGVRVRRWLLRSLAEGQPSTQERPRGMPAAAPALADMRFDTPPSRACCSLQRLLRLPRAVGAAARCTSQSLQTPCSNRCYSTRATKSLSRWDPPCTTEMSWWWRCSGMCEHSRIVSAGMGLGAGRVSIRSTQPTWKNPDDLHQSTRSLDICRQ